MMKKLLLILLCLPFIGFGQMLAVGDTYQGGIIFYLDGNGGGLIAAPSDQSSTNIPPFTGTEWGCYGTAIPGAGGTSIGTGAQNTIDIEAGCTTPGTAADICANLTLGGYSDWFLPSREELILMYTNLHLQGLGGFFNSTYWSSTEHNDVEATYCQMALNGGTFNAYKNFSTSVRAVRTFSSAYGCTDSLACNYDATVAIDDSSCVYPVIWQQAISICNGESIVVGNNVYDTTGNYTDTLTTVNGCDSIVYTVISLTAPVIWQQSLSICNGDSVIVGSSVYDTTGNYIDTLTAVDGCDSIVYTDISIAPSSVWQWGTVICYVGTVMVGTSVYDTTGNYIDTLSTVNGCDSIVYTNISIAYTSSYDTLSVTASIVWNGTILDNSGDYSVTLINSVGCDSIVNLNLTVTTTGILDIANNKNNLVKITDMLGQETPYRKNTPLFYIYDDGIVEKRIVIE